MARQRGRMVGEGGSLRVVRRYGPQKQMAAQEGVVILAADSDFLFGLPIAHVKRVGNNPRAGLQVLKQLGTKLQVHRG